MPTKAEQAYQRILALIESGELQPGEDLKIFDLAVRLDMSMTPVREALMSLGERGLVIRQTNRTTVVAPAAVARLVEVNVFRTILEPQAARLAALRGSTLQLAALEADLTAMRGAIERGDWATAEGLSSKFHLDVATAAGSDIMTEFVGRLWQFMPMRPLSRGHDHTVELRDHVAILAAIRAGDGEAAAAAMTAHVGHVGAAVQSYLDETMTNPETAAAP